MLLISTIVVKETNVKWKLAKAGHISIIGI